MSHLVIIIQGDPQLQQIREFVCNAAYHRFIAGIAFYARTGKHCPWIALQLMSHGCHDPKVGDKKSMYRCSIQLDL